MEKNFNDDLKIKLNKIFKKELEGIDLIVIYNFTILAKFIKSLYFLFIKSGHSSVVERLVANEKVEGSTPFVLFTF